MSIEEDRKQRDRTFHAVTTIALVMLAVWFFFAVTIWVISG